MRIYVLSSTGARIEVEVQPSGTVDELMGHIEEAMKVPRKQQKLLFAGKRLDPRWDFESINLQKDSTIHLVIRTPPSPRPLPGGAPPISVTVTVQPSLVGTAFEISEEATVGDLQHRIVDWFGLLLSEYRIVINGRVLRARDELRKVTRIPITDKCSVSVEKLITTPYEIFVRMIDGVIIPLAVSHAEPVSRIKSILAEVTGMKAPEFHLRFENTMLDEKETLMECRIDPGSNLEVFMSTGTDNNEEIFVHLDYIPVVGHENVLTNATEKPDFVLAYRSHTIFSIKEQIETKTAVPPHLQNILLNGLPMRDDWTLDSRALNSGERVQVELFRECDILISLRDADGVDISKKLQLRVKNWYSIGTVKRAAELSALAYNKRIWYGKREFDIYASDRLLQEDISFAQAAVTASTILSVRMQESPPARGDITELPGNVPSNSTSIGRAISPSWESMMTDISMEDVPETPSELESNDYHGASATLGYRTERPFDAKGKTVERSGGPHVLSEYSSELAAGADWKKLLPLLPDNVRFDIEYKSQARFTSCWTFTPASDITAEEIPLTIAGIPVVVPVDHQYPLEGPVEPPPDPYRRVINPRAPIDINTVAEIFETFVDALGCYVLINGMLQLLIPDEFDCEWASSYLPNWFGGLKVCYIPQSLDPTADAARQWPDPARFGNSPRAPAPGNTLRSPVSRLPSTAAAQTYPKLDSTIEARRLGSDSTGKHAGRIGVKTRQNSRMYLTMSSHVITKALTVADHGLFHRRWRHTSQTTLPQNWINDAEILIGNRKIGRVAQTFDPDAKDYPMGFGHDVSLVGPLDENTIEHLLDAKSPIPNPGWLSQDGWNNLRREPTNFNILIDQTREAKSIPTVRLCQCLVVGEGIFLNRRQPTRAEIARPQRPSNRPLDRPEVDMWTSLVSRSVLYRVHPDFHVAGGQSGAALYATGKREDGSTGPGVAGFQSFVQRSNHVQTYEMEGRPLEERLKKGYVAFYGAFQVPPQLKTEHVII